ncbi:hypothetical protein [Glycomyces buryatensis]|uniref:DUF3137 domain-containing protein n=1 Tax=Glycomyces buryatensis TaxID=2570927 RepID=A0A4S8QBC5_9ACTN|nr:hypothetical protein [Glycomyces buryatensis]THV41833.1 hypothetical protein FAB82_08910 [Glycomyces buryatensis]
MEFPQLAPWQIALWGLGLAFVLFVLFGMTRVARLYAPYLKTLHEQAASWAHHHRIDYAARDQRWLNVPRRIHPRGFSTVPTTSVKADDGSTFTITPDATFGAVTARPGTSDVTLGLVVEHVMNWTVQGMPMTAMQTRTPVASAVTRESKSHFWNAFKYRYWQIVMVRLPQPLPSLGILPNSRIMRHASNQLGYRDLTLEYQDFNRQYYIVSSDDRFSYDALMPQTMEWLRRLELGPQQLLVIDGDWCRLAKAQPMKLEELQPQAEILAGFVRSLPRRVWEQ